MRLYKSGTKWCVWRWTLTDSEYLTRLHLVKTPWFAICLHWINKPDPEEDLHDHPCNFVSIILRGGYAEFRNIDGNYYGLFEQRWINSFEAAPHDQHRIMNVAPGTVTLCFMGPKVREWGFHTDNGWVHWKDYYRVKRMDVSQNKG